MKDITVIIPILLDAYDAGNSELLNSAVESVKEAAANYKEGNVKLMIVRPEEDSRDDMEFQGIKYKYVYNPGKTDFCSQVNYAVDFVDTPYFSILEFDDKYSKIWFKMFGQYYVTNEDVSVFLPINIQYNADHTKWQYGNEIALSVSFCKDDEIGLINKESLENYYMFNLTGAIINTEDFISVGKYKPSIKLAFNYELMMRMAEEKMKMYVIPKEGYYHVMNRKGSLTDIYATEIPEHEVALWFDLAKRECAYKIDRWKTIVMPKKDKLQ